MKDQFRTFTRSAIAASKSVWLADARSTLAFPHDVERLFEWVESHSVHRDGDEVAYGIFNAGSDVAVGICEVVISRGGSPNAWVKHLRLWLNPKLDEELFDNKTEGVDQAIKLFSASIIGVMNLKLEHQASCMKVYGRTRDQLKFLHQVAVSLKEAMTQHDISVQGRFLVIADK